MFQIRVRVAQHPEPLTLELPEGVESTISEVRAQLIHVYHGEKQESAPRAYGAKLIGRGKELGDVLTPDSRGECRVATLQSHGITSAGELLHAMLNTQKPPSGKAASGVTAPRTGESSRRQHEDDGYSDGDGGGATSTLPSSSSNRFQTASRNINQLLPVSVSDDLQQLQSRFAEAWGAGGGESAGGEDVEEARRRERGDQTASRIQRRMRPVGSSSLSRRNLLPDRSSSAFDHEQQGDDGEGGDREPGPPDVDENGLTEADRIEIQSRIQQVVHQPDDEVALSRRNGHSTEGAFSVQVPPDVGGGVTGLEPDFGTEPGTGQGGSTTHADVRLLLIKECFLILIALFLGPLSLVLWVGPGVGLKAKLSLGLGLSIHVMFALYGLLPVEAVYIR